MPKVSVLTRKAYGGAYIVMSSKDLESDINLSWPTGEVAVMGAEGAVNIIHRSQIKSSDDPDNTRRALVEEYEERLMNPYVAASRGLIDDVIDPAETPPQDHPRSGNAAEQAGDPSCQEAREHPSVTLDSTPGRDDRIMAAVMAAVEAFLSEEAQTGEGRGRRLEDGRVAESRPLAPPLPLMDRAGQDAAVLSRRGASHPPSAARPKETLLSQNPIKITDTTFRDAHQSLMATRLRTSDMEPLAPGMDAVGFHSMEVWGGATFDSATRFLGEDPWDRLRSFKRLMPSTPLMMLLRGQSLVGYRNYADDVVMAFVRQAAEVGGRHIPRIRRPQRRNATCGRR